MRITVNILNSGLGNQGGSNTIIKSAHAMKNLGHDVVIACTVNNYTWGKIEVPLLAKIPPCDLVIATSCKTVESTLKASAPLKAYYIRGYEQWAMPVSKLEQTFKAGLINIVNSTWLSKVVPNSTVVYQGIDLEQWPNFGKRNLYGKIVIGCLHNMRFRTKKWHTFLQLQKLLGTKNFEYVAFGTNGVPTDMKLNTYLQNPTHKQLVALYNKTHFWFSPSTLEGLNNVPMEAGLCGCNIVGSNAISAGIQDYVIDGQTGWLYDKLDSVLKKFREYDESMNKRLVKVIHEKIGSREDAMRKFIEVCCRI